MDLHKPVIDDWNSPLTVEHDQACAVCGQNHAIFNINIGVFEPCGRCSSLGWTLTVKRKWWKRG